MQCGAYKGTRRTAIVEAERNASVRLRRSFPGDSADALFDVYRTRSSSTSRWRTTATTPAWRTTPLEYPIRACLTFLLVPHLRPVLQHLICACMLSTVAHLQTNPSNTWSSSVNSNLSLSSPASLTVFASKSLSFSRYDRSVLVSDSFSRFARLSRSVTSAHSSSSLHFPYTLRLPILSTYRRDRWSRVCATTLNPLRRRCC